MAAKKKVSAKAKQQSKRRFQPSDYSQQSQRPIKLKSTLRSDWDLEAAAAGKPVRERKVSTSTSRKPRETGTQWIIRGVSPEIKAASKEAAKASGLTLGEWIESRLSHTREATDAEMIAALLQDIERRLGALEEKKSFWDRLGDLVKGARR